MSARRISEPLPAEVTTLTSESLVVTPTHQLEGIELRSLAVFAAIFYSAAFVALGIGVAVVWFFASLLGLIGQFEEFMQSIGFRDFHVLAPRFILGGLLLALALIVFLTVMTVLAAALYNVMAHNGRTVRVRFGEAPPVTRDPSPDRVDTESIPRALVRRALRGSRQPSESIAAIDGGNVPARLRQ